MMPSTTLSRWLRIAARVASAVLLSLPTLALAQLACDAARAVGADYAGVDIVVDRQGDAYVIEVNGMPAWRSLQSVTRINLARCLVEDFVSRCVAPRLEAAC